MKLIRTVDAAGQVLCHDITQIIPGEYKDARFRKGHVIQLVIQGQDTVVQHCRAVAVLTDGCHAM